jgi:hypothetical protein
LQRSRREFDHRVLDGMAGPSLAVTAFPTARDLSRGANAISVVGAIEPMAYRITIRQRTLVGPESWAPETVIGVNTEGAVYPTSEPQVWAVNKPYPWSPHWHPEHGTFCIGPFWRLHQGKALVGDLVTHVARLLNWDETLEKGYVGWNPAAVARYWARNARPLIDGVHYPVVPSYLLTGEASGFSFRSRELDGGAFAWSGEQ